MSGTPEPAPAPAAPSAPSGPVAAPSALTGRTDLVFEGSILETVLTNRLEGGFTGPVNWQVTSSLYSHDHDVLPVPQGSRVLGEARKVAEQQQDRLVILSTG